MALEPFTIHCPTCGSGIRVRNPALIGKIANCPKCQSMLQIAAPGQVRIEPSGANSVDSTAMTREVAAPQDIEQNAPADQQDGDEYRLAPVDEQLDSEGSVGDAVNAEFESAAATWQPADVPLVPSEEWNNPKTTKSRQFLLVGLLGVFGVLLSIGGFFAFVNWYNAPSDPSPANGLAQAPGIPDIKDPSLDQSTDKDPIVGDMQQPADQAANDELNSTSSEVATHSGELESNHPAAEGTSTAGTLPVENGGQGTSSAAEDGGPAEGDAMDPASVAEGAGEPQVADESESDATSSQLPPQFAAMSALLDYNVQPTIPDEGILPSQAPLTAEDLGLASTVARPPVDPVDVAAQMEMTVAGLALSGAAPRLSHWLNLWTQIGGVPTVIDFDLFAAAGMDRNATLKLPTWIDVSNRQVMQDFANLVGATLRPVENRFVLLTPSNERIVAQLPKTISIDGLVKADDYDWLKDTLVSCFPTSEGQFEIADGQLAFTGGENELRVWVDLTKMLTTWKAMKLSPPAPPASWLVNEFVEQSSVSGLDFMGTIVSPQSRPVGQVLSKICQDAGIDGWIDWANVGSVGLGPRTTEVVATHNRPLRDALADYAVKFPLIVAIIDDTSLLFTSPAAYRSSVQSYVLPTSTMSAQAWADRLRDLTPSGDGSVGALEIHPTPDGQFIIVRCCRPRVIFPEP